MYRNEWKYNIYYYHYNSIHQNHKNSWEKGVYSLIIKQIPTEDSNESVGGRDSVWRHQKDNPQAAPCESLNLKKTVPAGKSIGYIQCAFH